MTDPTPAANNKGNTPSTPRIGFKAAVVQHPDKVTNVETGRTRLMDAIMEGNQEKITALIEAGANISKTDHDGKTALHLAARLGQVETIKSLVKHGASANARDKHLATPLFEAVNCRNQIEVVQCLLEAGANPDLADAKENIPLHFFALKSNNAEAVALLAHATENPNRPDAKGMTPLLHACETGTLDIVKALVKEKLSLFIANMQGETALHLATARPDKNTAIARYLLTVEGAQLVNAFNLGGKTPFHTAVTQQSEELVQEMLSLGAHPNLPDSQGYTPLYFAAQWNGKLPILLSLIHAGADLEKPSGVTKMTPLMMAINSSNQVAISTLIDYGADPNTPDSTGNTLLMTAVSRGSQQNIDLLLRAGAKADLQDQKGKTALHLACRVNCSKEAAQLIAEKANPNIQDKEGQTPLYAAANLGWGNYELAKTLIAGGADPLIRANDGLCAYDIAAARGETSIVEIFKKALAEKNISYSPKVPEKPLAPVYTYTYYDEYGYC